jgi:hypothetical protein
MRHILLADTRDIATELKFSTRTIVRKIGRICQEWGKSETNTNVE